MNTCDYGCCPREVLDLFCGAGGAAMGLHRAWPHARIIGVDTAVQSHYPFNFHQGDAMTYPMRSFDFIWASPPCQGYTTMNLRFPERRATHPRLIADIRTRLQGTTAVWVIENVTGARSDMNVGLRLHGGMFGLRVHRPRLFESPFLLMESWAPKAGNIVGVYGNAPDGRRLWGNAPHGTLRAAKGLADAADAMQVDWMDWHELKESIPPAYSEYIAHQLTPVFQTKVA